MKWWVSSALAILAGASMLSGCNSITVAPYKNEAFCPTEEPRCLLPDYRVPDRDPNVARAVDEFEDLFAPAPGVFVGLALSGGGSRAANFSLAVMQELERIGVMQHVTAISSTSGGGVAGAYYALNGERLTDDSPLWSEARATFRENFRTKWLGKALLPWNLAATSLSTYDRSDLMAEILNDRLFDNKRFKDLTGRAGPRRPIWIANSTNAANGRLFPFTSREFRHIWSRLDTYPIADAVVASAAFPGAFNSKTLREYPPYDLPPSYTHVFDGGPADNLGINSLLRLAASTAMSGPYDDLRRSGGRKPTRAAAPCLLIVVDAYPQGVAEIAHYRSDPRDAIDNFVDFNFMQAFDHFLTYKRNHVLKSMALDRRHPRPSYGRMIAEIGFVEAPERSVSSTIEIPLSALSEARPDLLRSARAIEPEESESAESTQTHLVCKVWHLAFDNLLSFEPMHPDIEALPPGVSSDEALVKRIGWFMQDNEPYMDYHAKLKTVASQITTDFNLTGPARCSPAFLQEVLYEAARVVVQEEVVARKGVCKWLDAHGAKVPAACSDHLPPRFDASFLESVRPAELPLSSSHQPGQDDVPRLKLPWRLDAATNTAVACNPSPQEEVATAR